MSSEKPIKIVTIAGSVRPNNMTSMALALVIDEIRQHPDIHLEAVDPTEMKLLFPGEESNQSTELLHKIVSGATGVVLATPEYHGSYSSVMKLIIENLGYPSVLSGKPVALLGVADGQIGAVKALEHLRSVCSHIGAIVLPYPVSVSGVHKLFSEEGKCLNPEVEKRIRSVATNLITYIRKHICPGKAFEEFVREN